MTKPTAATSQKFARCIDCIALSYAACLYLCIHKYVYNAIIIIYNNYYYRYYHYDCIVYIGSARFTPSPRKRLLFRYANVPRANNHISKTAAKRCRRRRRLDGPSVYYHI